MSKPTVKAKEIVEDVRRGWDDASLMRKHGLSAEQLRKVLSALVDAGSLEQFELDRRSGAPVWECPTCGSELTMEDGQCNACGKSTFIIVDSDMADKADAEDLTDEVEFVVSPTGEAKLRRLDGASLTRGQAAFQPPPKTGKLLDRPFFDASAPSLAEPASAEDLEAFTRGYFIFSVPIYDTSDLGEEGSVDAFQRNSIHVSGIPVEVGETRSFLIRADEYADVYPFVFEAVCRWVKPGADGRLNAGFEVTSISKAGLEQLRRMFGRLAI